MEPFFYSTVVGGKVSPSYNELFPTVSSLQVKEAFNFCGKFHNTEQKKKKNIDGGTHQKSQTG